MTLISRIFGFIRDMVLASTFGAGLAMDAFTVAFKLPNLLRRLFAEGAFSQSFLPVLMEYKKTQDLATTRLFVSRICGLLSLVLVTVTVIGIIAAPWIMWISAPGFSANPQKFDLAVQLLRITFPYILFISLASLASGILNAWNQFSVPAFAPTLLNISLILCALFLAPYCHPPILALSLAVFMGGLLQLLFLLPYVQRIGMLVIPCFDFKDSAIWCVIKQMGPAIFGVSVAQLSLVINTIFASFLPSGSISWIYFADRLMELPVGLLGASLGILLLPLLSKHAVENDLLAFSQLLDWGLRLSLLLALPASVGLAMLALPLIQTLFMYGQFTPAAAYMTQQALVAYAVGLVGIVLVKVLAPSFYANKDIKTPVKVAIFSLIMIQLMNGILIWHLRHAGLALSIALGACLNAGVLLFLLLKHKHYIPQPGWGKFLAKLALSALTMAATLLFLQYILPCYWEGNFIERVLWLALLISAGVAVYFSTLFVVGIKWHHWIYKG